MSHSRPCVQDEARRAVVAGATALANAVRPTLGSIDPTKVVRLALANAVSVAGTLLLTEATLTEIEEPHPEPAAVD